MCRLRTLLLSVLLLSPFAAGAQEGKFGYIDFNGTLKLMPEYLEAQLKLQQIQSEFKSEIDRSKREFERQYIDFMLEQDQMSPSIVSKRQKELQVLMDNNVEFRSHVQAELEAKRDELLNPLKQKLLLAVSKVCQDKGLDYVIDTGTRTYLYINAEKGVDISHPVYVALKIEEPESGSQNSESGQVSLNPSQK